MIPNPLHPALVHFPIALILLGTLVAIAAIILRRWHLPAIAAGLLICGAAGAVAAAWSGGQAVEMVGELSPAANEVLEFHEEWGERARTISIIAAVLATAAAATVRIRILSMSLTVVTALVALGAALCVASAGHFGGQLVYKHGVGVNVAAGSPAQETGSHARKPDND